MSSSSTVSSKTAIENATMAMQRFEQDKAVVSVDITSLTKGVIDPIIDALRKLAEEHKILVQEVKDLRDELREVRNQSKMEKEVAAAQIQILTQQLATMASSGASSSPLMVLGGGGGVEITPQAAAPPPPTPAAQPQQAPQQNRLSATSITSPPQSSSPATRWNYNNTTETTTTPTPSYRPLGQQQTGGSGGGVHLGVDVQDSTSGLGVEILKCTPGGVMSLAGLREGDVIVEAQGVRIMDLASFVRLVSRLEVGHELHLRYVREAYGLSKEREAILHT
eukprot:PhF_6_TR3392/c0_g1_i1/m.4849